MNSKSILFGLLLLSTIQVIHTADAIEFLKGASYTIKDREIEQLRYYTADGKLIEATWLGEKTQKQCDPNAPLPQPVSCTWSMLKKPERMKKKPKSERYAAGILKFLDKDGNVICGSYYDPRSRLISKTKILQPGASVKLKPDTSITTLASSFGLDLSKLDETEFITKQEEWLTIYHQ